MAANAKQIQFVRGTTAAHASYTGVEGSISYDTSKKTLRAHDGVTAGGTVLAKEAIKLKTDSENLLKFNSAAEANHAADISVTVDKEAIAAKLVSTKSDNALKIANASGEDKLLYVEAQDTEALVATGEKVIFAKNEGSVKKLATNLQFAYDKLTGLLTVKGGAAGTTEIATLEIPTSLTLLKTARVVTNPAGQPEGTYLEFVFSTQAGTGHDTTSVFVNVTDFIDINTAGDGLKINSTDKRKIEVKLSTTSSAGNMLMLDSDKAMYVPTDFGTLD